MLVKPYLRKKKQICLRFFLPHLTNPNMGKQIFLLEIEPQDVSSILNRYKNDFIKEKGMPRIVDGAKKYTDFKIKLLTGQLIQENKKYAILENQVAGCIVAELILKKEMFTNDFIQSIKERIMALTPEERTMLCDLIESYLKDHSDDKILREKASHSVYVCALNMDLAACGEQALIYLQSSILLQLEQHSIKKFHSKDKIIKILMPHSMQHLGTVLILNLNPVQTLIKTEIAEYFWSQINLKSIYRKSDFVSSVNRTTAYELLKGEDNMKISYRENGLKFVFDLDKVYFNSKLSGAREQLLSNFKDKDVIADLFCGIGPISLQALKKGCQVICSDINADAIDSLRENLKLNNFTKNFIIYNNCARKVLRELDNNNFIIDHFVFNLPELSIYFINELKNFKEKYNDGNCMLHCFFFCKKDLDPYQYILTEINVHLPNDCITLSRNVSPSKNYLYLKVRLGDIDFL
ncbi:tRNA modification enzyme [Pseudoloma neurophilia]|uniref:tRNA modification enzyme n=1 Tax=Pseudoloma neurophilia TaxID=146866 RepID=A0A0R0M0S4_9MICR|nr:tRNA modification enzyme [Pseudoloma neurophilia]